MSTAIEALQTRIHELQQQLDKGYEPNSTGVRSNMHAEKKCTSELP